MKKMNKKGFTIVELSIVIAVIAILSAVLIPTFTGIVNKSKKSAAAQAADTALTAVLTEELVENEDHELDSTATYYFISGDYWFKYQDRTLVDATAVTDAEADSNDIIYTSNGALANDAPIKIALDNNNNPVIEASKLEDVGNVIVWVQVPNA